MKIKQFKIPNVPLLCTEKKIAGVLECIGIWTRKVVVLACLLLLVSCQAKIQPEKNQAQVKVARVLSGQTLEVLGIDAPDLHQRPWGNEGKKLLETLIGDLEKPVMLEFDLAAKDKIGRTLAYVWKDKKLLNEEVVKQGYALFVERSPNHKYDQRLERAQQWARLMGQGIWNPEKPMRSTPAEFRRLNR